MKHPIVLSLIVLNEAKNIERLLNNFCIIEGIKDVLIVDTGSTDDTVEIIRAFFKTHNIDGLVLEHQFYNKRTKETCLCHPDSESKKIEDFHFGEARSYAIDMCFKLKSMCKFILMPDADLYLAKEDTPNVVSPVGLINYIEAVSTGKIHNQTKSFWSFFDIGGSRWPRPMLFSNDDTWRYSGALHEYLTPKAGSFPIRYDLERVYTEDLKSGPKFFIKQDRKDNTGGRNDVSNKIRNDALFLEKLLERMKPNEENYHRYMFYCSQSWIEDKNFRRFDYWSDKIFEHPEMHWIEEVYCTYINRLASYLYKERKIDDIDKILRWCNDGIKTRPLRVELYFYKAKFLLEYNRKDEAISTLEKTLCLEHNPMSHLSRAHLYKESKDLYYSLKNSNIALVISSAATEFDMVTSGLVKYLERFQKVTVINFNNSFTGVLKFEQSSESENFTEVIFVDTIVDFKTSSPKVLLNIGDSKRVYSQPQFNIVWESDVRLKEFLASQGFVRFQTFKDNVMKTEDISEVIVPTSETNFCFSNKREIDPNLLYYDFKIIPGSDKSCYNLSIANKLFPLGRKIYSIDGSDDGKDPLVFFMKAEAKLKNADINDLDYIYDEISREYNNLSKDYYMKESINNLIAIRYVKDLQKREFMKKQDLPSYELFKKSGKQCAPKILMSMTTCRRYELFRETMISVMRKFAKEDLDMVHTFLIVDDGSSEEDVAKMREEFGSLFEIITGESKGHPNSMNIIYRKAVDEGFDYVVHLEDDFVFIDRKNYISDCLEILQNDPQVSQVLFNRFYQLRGNDELMYMNEMSRDVKRIRESGPRYVHHLHNISDVQYETALNMYFDNDNLGALTTPRIIDPIDPMRKTQSCPGFSFHPSMFSVEKTFKRIGTYVTYREFERCYSTELFWNTPFKTAFLDDFSVYHKGHLNGFDIDGKNAYDRNPEGNALSKILVVVNHKTSDEFKQFKESHIDTKYDLLFIDDYSRMNYGKFNTQQEIINFRENMVKGFKMYDEIIRLDRPIVYDKTCMFKTDIYGYDIGRFDNTRCQLTIEEMRELTRKAGGNAFNTLGYMKKIPEHIIKDREQHKVIPFFRYIDEGLYIL